MTKWLHLCGTAATLAALLAGLGCSGAKQPIAESPSLAVNSPSLPTRGGQPPAPPTLYFPPEKSLYTTPLGNLLFALRTTDPEGDRVQYKIELLKDGQVVAVFDQTQNKTGWLNRQALWSGTLDGVESFASGEFAYLKVFVPELLKKGHNVFQWRAYAFDGTNWSDPSVVRTFIFYAQ